ncbi:MAG: HD domain-containing protein [Candidatus Eremiobacteraeota bacterium]|nr:HD domain-containing protein [Candidatus Eremiobacteraeota bacterium]
MTPSSAAETETLLLTVLPEAGVYAVGGSVRDAVLAELGRPQARQPDHDYLVTGLALQTILDRLAKHGGVEVVGASFGVIKFTRAERTVDIALPRRESSTGPHHRDFQIESAPDVPLEEDLARRDFRMNMMARDLRSGAIVDPYGGRTDLEYSRLDTLRQQAFEEDPLRILRGAQFAARFGLAPTAAVLAAMRGAADRVPTVAAERVADEVEKLLTLAERPSVGIELLRESGALAYVMPELLEGWQIEQNQFHAYSVYEHALHAVDAAPPDLVLRLAALLHDVGKPRTKEGPHFYGHQQVGEAMARSLLTRLRFGGDVIERVARLIANHMYSTADVITDAGVRRFIRRVGRANVGDLFALRRADIVASGLPPHDGGENQRFEARVAAMLGTAPPLDVSDLRINGDDVIAIMRESGLADASFRGDDRVGATLRACLEEVLEDPARNERETLLQAARRFLARNSYERGSS